MQPLADPALHDGTPAGDALRQALGDGELRPIYGTEVMRLQRLVRAPGCMVELAFDQGALVAGESRWPLCELEFELKSGEPAALAALASRWVARFGLTLDVRTKAERGERLARGVRLGAPVKAQPLALPEARGQPDALRQVLGNCLAQVLANASDIAHEADTEPEQLHQLRVGLRRLRTALRELGPLSAAAAPRVGRGSWAGCSAAWARRATATRWRRRCCRHCARPAPPGWSCRASRPSPRRRRRCASPATTQLWLQLLAFAAGGGVSARGLRAGGAAAPGAAVQAGAARCSALRHARRHGPAPAAQARQAAALPERVRRRLPSAPSVCRPS